MAEHQCTSRLDITSIDKRLAIVETEQRSMKGDISDIKQSLKENRVFTLTILATSLISAVGVIITLLNG